MINRVLAVVWLPLSKREFSTLESEEFRQITEMWTKMQTFV